MNRNPATKAPDFTRVIVMGDVQASLYTSMLHRWGWNRSFTIPLAQPNDAMLFIGNVKGSMLDDFMASRFPRGKQVVKK